MLIKSNAIILYKSMKINFNLIKSIFLRKIGNFITPKKQIKHKIAVQNKYKTCFI